MRKTLEKMQQHRFGAAVGQKKPNFERKPYVGF
jgi:hypothetical protein